MKRYSWYVEGAAGMGGRWCRVIRVSDGVFNGTGDVEW